MKLTIDLHWPCRGNDIDHIEIKTDDGEAAGGADKRKTYNYRYTYYVHMCARLIVLCSVCVCVCVIYPVLL